MAMEMTSKPAEADPEMDAAMRAFMEHLRNEAERYGVTFIDVTLGIDPNNIHKVIQWYKDTHPTNGKPQ